MATQIALCNLVVISDTHCGCQLGLCPPKRIRLDEGGSYSPSRLQRKVWRCWEDLWRQWVPEATRGEPYAIVVNGDTLDGRHHGAVTQFAGNLADQARVAYEALAPVVEGHPLYMIRGTEAHVGPSAEAEEQLAERLGAIPDEDGRYARWELWKWLAGRKKLVHFLHHIGVTGSQAYEATAVHKELVEAFAEAARWRQHPPNAVIRSHRHRFTETRIPTADGAAIAAVTPGWQLKTPFAWKVPGGRQSLPQIGALLVRVARGEIYVREKIYPLTRSRAE